MSLGPVSLPQVKNALQELGGEATWIDILTRITANRNGDHSYYRNLENYQKTAFQIIQCHCQGYAKYNGPAHFEKAANRRFRLIGEVSDDEHSTSPLTPIATDFGEPSKPGRVKQETYRILRDTTLARQVKETHQFRCQICDYCLEIGAGKPYAEAHHIKPLGAPHNGPDVRENILCVCPNHHVLLDYGAMILERAQLKGIGDEYIDYHNKHIFRMS